MATLSVQGAAQARRPDAYEVRLLGGFDLRRGGETIDVAPSSQRVIAFLALHDRRLLRSFVAETLWPDTTDERAAANLRTALWRLHVAGHDVVEIVHGHLGVRDHVGVDVRSVELAARRLRHSGEEPDPLMVETIRGELLPGCWDSWLVFERERVRAELVLLYERLAAGALQRGDHHLAVMAALAAVECDPLRESSNALLVRASLAGGDHATAIRQYRRYSRLIETELGLAPGDELQRLMEGCLTPR